MTAEKVETSSKWLRIIQELQSKGAEYDEQIIELSKEYDSLILDAELGETVASGRLKQIRLQLTDKQLAAQNIQVALVQAKQKLTLAQAEEDRAREEERQHQLRVIISEYMMEVERVDRAMRELSEYLTNARLRLNAATALMNPQEQSAVQQLYNLFGPTLAMSHYGLGDFIQLGPLAGHVIHRKPLTAFATAFVDRWVDPKPNEQPKEEVHSNG